MQVFFTVLQLANLVITGSTAGTFGGAGQHYSIGVSSTVYGEITVDVAADLVLDAAVHAIPRPTLSDRPLLF